MNNDGIRFMRGVLIGFLACIPFWVALWWLL
jgi:hypothetical protein